MKRQAKSYWCGVASIANALEVLGIKRSQREIARLCAVTEDDGTDETEMKRALLANGVHVDELHQRTRPIALYWAEEHITHHGPVVICVDSDEHWCTIIGRCMDRFVLFDPARNHGIEVHSWVSLAKRWVNDEGVYYGLGVSK